MPKLGKTAVAPGSVARQQQEQREQLKAIFQAVVISVAVAALAALLYVYFVSAPVHQIDATDSAKMREIVYGGQPWLLYCRKGPDEAIPQMIEAVAQPLWSSHKISVGGIDCQTTLPSGHTVARRFALDTSKGLTVFLACNGKKVHEVPGRAMVSHGYLMNYAERFCAVKLQEPTDKQQFELECLSKKTCAVVLHGGEITATQHRQLLHLAQTFRTVTFNLLDVRAVTLDFGIPETTPEAMKDLSLPAIFVIRRNSTRAAKNGEKAGISLYKGTLGNQGLIVTLNDAINEQNLRWVTAAPSVTFKQPPSGPKRRPKKPKSTKAKAPKRTAKATESTSGMDVDADDNVDEESALERERRKRQEMDRQAEELISGVDDDHQDSTADRSTVEEEGMDDEFGDDELVEGELDYDVEEIVDLD